MSFVSASLEGLAPTHVAEAQVVFMPILATSLRPISSAMLIAPSRWDAGLGCVCSEMIATVVALFIAEICTKLLRSCYGTVGWNFHPKKEGESGVGCVRHSEEMRSNVGFRH